MDKDAINFNNIANLNYSSNKSDNEKRFILEDEEEELPKINKIKITFNEALQKMKKNFEKLSNNVPYIIKEKKFSYNYLIQNYKNNQILQNLKQGNSLKNNYVNNSTRIVENNLKIDKNMNNKGNNNINNKNKIELNNLDSNSSKSSKNSNKMIGIKTKRENNNKEYKKEAKHLFEQILKICKQISELNKDNIKIIEENDDIQNEESKEKTIIYNNKKIVSVYLYDNKIQKIIIHEDNKIYIEENKIIDNLIIIKNNMKKILDMLNKKK